MKLDLVRRSVLAALASTLLLPIPSDTALAVAPSSLEFMESKSGLRYADFKVGNGPAVAPDSRVTMHIVGRLVGKQGWVFENSQRDEDEPYRLVLGQGSMIAGLEEGLQGMHEGGVRRLLIPSNLGYVDKTLEPIPRDFGQRQRLYTTVLNGVRRRQESQALGSDLAGVVMLDVQLMRVRAP